MRPIKIILIVCRCVVLVPLLLIILPANGTCMDPLLSLGLEDLSQIKVEEAYATLSSLDPREVPATVTVITADDIVHSGARSLDELLDIYVPGFQYMYKTHGSQAGIRGIISDRNNKLLLTVNGRSMNVKASDGGAITERWFSMLGDIRRITVVCGPGSAVYGPGAIAGIINIETWDGKDFTGLDLSLRGGLCESFGALEARYGSILPDGTALFAYYGLDYYPGARQDHAPLKFSFDFEYPPHQNKYHADSEATFPVPNDNGSFKGLLRHKFHFQLNGENFEAWVRYTLSGQRIPAPQPYYTFSESDKFFDNGAGNQQLTIFGRYCHDVSRWLTMEYVLSYMLSDVQISYGTPQDVGNRYWSEDETQARIMAHIIPADGHKVAIGAEYYYDNLGRRGFLKRDEPSSIYGLGDGTQWTSHMVSFVGEYQLRLHYNLLGIAGLRADKHRFTSWMLSPRAALIYTPDAINTLKFIYNRSVRHADDADLYSAYLQGNHHGDIETIDNFEVIYERQRSRGLHFSLSAFYNRHHVVAFDSTRMKSDYVGLAQTYGVEAAIKVHTPKVSAVLAHSFTKLMDFDLNRDALIQNISASPYGYGNDLANWVNNATKLVLDYKFTDLLSWHSSVRIYWGLPGAEDMARYNMDTLDILRLPVYEGDDGIAFGKSILLTAGLSYRMTPHTSFTLHGYNLLGLFDRDLNKRNFFQRTSMYRDAAPAVALRISHSF